MESAICKEMSAKPELFDNIIGVLLDREDIVRLNDKVTYHKDRVKEAREKVVELARKHDGITLIEFRDETGLSRKYCMAILDYFDSVGVTQRDRDKHRLTGSLP